MAMLRQAGGRRPMGPGGREQDFGYDPSDYDMGGMPQMPPAPSLPSQVNYPGNPGEDIDVGKDRGDGYDENERSRQGPGERSPSSGPPSPGGSGGMNQPTPGRPQEANPVAGQEQMPQYLTQPSVTQPPSNPITALPSSLTSPTPQSLVTPMGGSAKLRGQYGGQFGGGQGITDQGPKPNDPSDLLLSLLQLLQQG